jgi:hypothetical protein
MLAPVMLELRRETVVTMLAAYAQTALPSAMVSILAEALTLAAERRDRGAPEDVIWMRHVASELRSDVVALRRDEDVLYLGLDAEKVG